MKKIVLYFVIYFILIISLVYGQPYSASLISYPESTYSISNGNDRTCSFTFDFLTKGFGPNPTLIYEYEDANSTSTPTVMFSKGNDAIFRDTITVTYQTEGDNSTTVKLLITTPNSQLITINIYLNCLDPSQVVLDFNQTISYYDGVRSLFKVYYRSSFRDYFITDYLGCDSLPGNIYCNVQSLQIGGYYYLEFDIELITRNSFSNTGVLTLYFYVNEFSHNLNVNLYPINQENRDVSIKLISTENLKQGNNYYIHTFKLSNSSTIENFFTPANIRQGMYMMGIRASGSLENYEFGRFIMAPTSSEGSISLGLFTKDKIQSSQGTVIRWLDGLKNQENEKKLTKTSNLLGGVYGPADGYLTDISLERIDRDIYITKIYINDPNSVNHIILNAYECEPAFSMILDENNLISGTSTNGVWALVYNASNYKSNCNFNLIYSLDTDNTVYYAPFDYFTTISPPSQYYGIFNPTYGHNAGDFDNFRFISNSVDTSDLGFYNSLLFEIVDSSDTSKLFTLVYYRDGFNEQRFRSEWDSVNGCYRINFEIPPRMFDSIISYTIELGSSGESIFWTELQVAIGDNAILRVSSFDADCLGPRVISVDTYPSDTYLIDLTPYSDSPFIEVGFTLRIVDYLTESATEGGFGHGIIYVSFLFVEYPIEIVLPPNENIYDFTYTVLFNVSTSASNEIELTLTRVELYDIYGNILPTAEFASVVIPVSISFISDTTPIYNSPQVSSINFNSFNIDVGFNTNNYISVELNVSSANPLYVSPLSNMFFFCDEAGNSFSLNYQSSFFENSTFATVIFNGTIPYGCGIVSGLTLDKINGVSDLIGQQLSEWNTPGHSISNSQQRFIQSTSDFYYSGGVLNVYGYYLNTTENTYFIDFLNGTQVSVDPLPDSNNVFQRIFIGPTDKPFTITIYRLGEPGSNELRVNPIPDPHLVPEPTTTPTPTSKPPQCAGTPTCSGNGVCAPTGCKCASPWIGNDCSSRQIIIPQPTINNTSPSTAIDYNDTLPNGETISFSSLVSLIEIREISYNGDIIERYPLEKWILTDKSSLSIRPTYLYSTNITKPNQHLLNIHSNNGGDYNNQIYQKLQSSTPNTQVNVKIEWFDEYTVVKFAKQNIIMQASTIKYNIDISQYPFSSKLNSLVLIFSASIVAKDQSSSTCSYTEQGTSSENNELDYVKIQMDSQSLYGRFIKRAMIDHQATTISNNITESNQSPTSTDITIAINIPNYNIVASLDPDFSVLLDSSPASSKSESDCNSNVKKGLSKTQLIGIIIGSSLAGICTIIVISYFVYKKRQTLTMMKNFNKKF